MTIAIRPERRSDEATIHALTASAFADRPFSNGSEPGIIDRLRADGDLSLSLVAEQDGAILGHIAFSPVEITNGAPRWFGLGPVSVRPDEQGNGIGGDLIRAGIEVLERDGAKGIVLLGDPAYYSRFGFAPHAGLTYPGLPPEYFQVLLLSGDWPHGTVRYAPAFG